MVAIIHKFNCCCPMVNASMMPGFIKKQGVKTGSGSLQDWVSHRIKTIHGRDNRFHPPKRGMFDASEVREPLPRHTLKTCGVQVHFQKKAKELQNVQRVNDTLFHILPCHSTDVLTFTFYRSQMTNMRYTLSTMQVKQTVSALYGWWRMASIIRWTVKFAFKPITSKLAGGSQSLIKSRKCKFRWFSTRAYLI